MMYLLLVLIVPLIAGFAGGFETKTKTVKKWHPKCSTWYAEERFTEWTHTGGVLKLWLEGVMYIAILATFVAGFVVLFTVLIKFGDNPIMYIGVPGLFVGLIVWGGVYFG